MLRYEDLLANPEAEIRLIAGFLGKQASKKQAQDIAAATSFEQLRRQEAEHGFTEAVRSGGFFRVGKAQQWRDVKDQSVFQPLLDKFSRLMRRYGYLKARRTLGAAGGQTSAVALKRHPRSGTGARSGPASHLTGAGSGGHRRSFRTTAPSLAQPQSWSLRSSYSACASLAGPRRLPSSRTRTTRMMRPWGKVSTSPGRTR